MTEKEFNEIDPCKEGLKNIAIDMIKYDIKEIKISKPIIGSIYQDPLAIEVNYIFKDGSCINRLLLHDYFVEENII